MNQQEWVVLRIGARKEEKLYDMHNKKYTESIRKISYHRVVLIVAAGILGALIIAINTILNRVIFFRCHFFQGSLSHDNKD